ncbi:bacterial extracellular solute-binding protein [Variibacter gotjawalensis]|uniref:Bacterial extracellular solute-binding protein n=1 Tax=Variibacter gotjawalensis TaxID=1333996 RepID=A0A0S3Q0X9_9BRAD|nr:extracellular solute-binding protein [Variibacter gotjawalensis]NIK47646.1 multiple sugar transport system substrate-binding protein [Variibacter gotjawalensis]RZS49543.1 carbohydrate ABC transporter substrate-binding protein (CUT1 family) [Variibacter gotjawalensis]BAT61806.1 bacterial extracellular solute-binding protein [Variibacter gotjawalensis]
MRDFTRRDALALGVSAAALAATGAKAQTSNVKAANVPTPDLKIESGATLRMLRPVRFVKPDEDVFRANAERFKEKTGVDVKVDFVGWEDINQQTAVTANSGAGPDLIIGFGDAPHIYQDKLIELTDVAEYLDKKYGGWMRMAQRYGKKHDGKGWIGLPFGSSGGPLVFRKSMIKAVGYDTVPEDHDKLADLFEKLKKSQKPVGFALGNAVGDGNGFANWLMWSHNAALLDEEGKVSINSKETIAALTYLKKIYPNFIDGTASWGDVSNNRAYSAGDISLTSNGVSLYFSMKNDTALQAIAEDTDHQLMPKGLATTAPMAGLTLNAMVFKHSKFPNASRAFLMFMLEKEQYEPWLNANNGYWAQPLAAYADAAVWNGDPKVKLFKDTMNSGFWNGYKGPITAASGAVNADYVMVQMCAAVATGAATPEQAAREAERRAQRYFRR